MVPESHERLRGECRLPSSQFGKCDRMFGHKVFQLTASRAFLPVGIVF